MALVAMARPGNWNHDREHFYKYATASTAKAILRNRTLRWSFNDPFDAQFDLHLEYDRDQVVQSAMHEIWQKYSGDKPIVIGNLLGVGLTWLRDLARGELEKTLLPGLIEGIERAEAVLELLARREIARILHHSSPRAATMSGICRCRLKGYGGSQETSNSRSQKHFLPHMFYSVP